MKELTALQQRALIAPYMSPDQGGELVIILKATGITIWIDRAHEIAEVLEERGYVKNSSARKFADLDLTDLGIDYVEDNLI